MSKEMEPRVVNSFSIVGCEQSHLLQEHEELQERTTLRYEERITELHSVIAELNKKIQLLQGDTIREEDELSELRSDLSRSQQEVNEEECSVDQDPEASSLSVPENSSTLITADMGFRRVFLTKADSCSDLNSELQRVLTGLESVLCGRKKSTSSLSVAEVDKHIQQLTSASQHCDLALKTVEELEGALDGGMYPGVCEERGRWEQELLGLREENQSLTAMLCRREEDLNRTRSNMNSIREERDRLRRRVAERVKLSKTRSESLPADRSVLGSEISSIGVSSSVAEHLAHSLQDCSNLQEIFQTLYSHGSTISESKIREFQVETERLNSRIEHLKSQNDLLTITLEECKSNAERMSLLVGKYESNTTALRLALQYSEQCMEAFELLLALAESEQSLVLSQFRATGVGALGECERSRKAAESAAKDLLARLDGSCGSVFTAQPWESLSSNSHTSTTSSTASSSDTEFSKEDEQRLKDYIQQLKNDRAAVKLTVLELESVHIDPDTQSHPNTHQHPAGDAADTHRLDLENAVLMQELMAMKEELAELKAQLYLLEKEKKALELKLNTREAQEEAFLLHIQHLKAELNTHSAREQDSGDSPSLSVCDSDLAVELSGALRREKKLKARVQELLTALEKLTKSSEARNQQATEFIADLKRANSNLVAAYEKAKRKHQNKLKKLESQMVSLRSRHETQVRMLKQRISLMEEESQTHANETSL
ncbi:hypothetical protein DNTS_003286 [Danionella cerebrum]|uniref:Harmonin-binding protein USHBP1 PDZ-binding domain-containing protein n=1 Tax=Danionella cerebrum TaxID=2873325 RepID=A0A553MVL0_9TELE|nr:hypothetical protein DNTS_003286 [Danionella translucida]